MPEGPEVECVKRELQQLIGKKILKIELTPLSQKYPKYKDKQGEFKDFLGKRFQNIFRFGKFLVWCFDGTDKVILNHLGMSGRWCFYPNALPDSVNHQKVKIIFDTPPHTVFDDTRNFGQFRAFPSLDAIKKYSPIKTLGVDGLKDPFPQEEFLKILTEQKYQDKDIGEVIIDQRVVAGVGNIYKAESLFEARIHPLRKVKNLTSTEKETLGESIGKILQKAIVCGGTTFGTQPYSHPSGREGEAQSWHNVYGKSGQPCTICNSMVERIVQKDRSTFFCPHCQK